MSLRAAALGLLLLAGCAVDGPVGTGATFIPDDGGLGLTDRDLRIDFGRAPDGVVRALTRERGRPVDLPLSGCPDTITRHLRWGRLDLTFTRDRFVGWRQGEAAAGLICDPPGVAL
ncbi:hypothetical protein RGUI_2438 [Rhodovulum sp. P5]|uniref:hypothetical protein n=1 Tax=Rhodovulum sp. P5 TaxID=1564506 RepID=UPI0009C21BDE|nr:hypothetical protein [Rhodovulum sp. P5]ARE40579.1 hypothetical protein RGUI_2438 [Rhodovulum sp. P5]